MNHIDKANRLIEEKHHGGSHPGLKGLPSGPFVLLKEYGGHNKDQTDQGRIKYYGGKGRDGVEAENNAELTFFHRKSLLMCGLQNLYYSLRH